MITRLLFFILLLTVGSCRMNQISTTSSSVLINFDEPSIYTDFYVVFINNERYIKILVEIIPNVSKQLNSNDSLYTFGITLEIASTKDSLMHAKKDEITLPISKKNSVLEYVYPIDNNEVNYRLQIISRSFYDDKIFTHTTLSESTVNKEIGSVEPGYISSNGHFSPFVKYVQQLESEKEFVVHVTHKNTSSDSVQLRVLRILSDDEIARPIHSRQYSTTSLSFRGIDYRKTKEVYSYSSKLKEEAEETIFKLPVLEEGNYSIELVSLTQEKKENLLSKKKLSFVDEKFPYYGSIKKQVEPYSYILPQDVYEKINGLSNPDSIEYEFISYFKNQIKSKTTLAEVLKLYSNRVSEANYFFTNFKEGWKTDMGMIYIIYGPPLFVTRRYDEVFWHYTHEPNDRFRVFSFRRVRLNSVYFPFDHYLLRRSPDYFQLNYSRVNDWRTGAIIKYNRF